MFSLKTENSGEVSLNRNFSIEKENLIFGKAYLCTSNHRKFVQDFLESFSFLDHGCILQHGVIHKLLMSPGIPIRGEFETLNSSFYADGFNGSA